MGEDTFPSPMTIWRQLCFQSGLQCHTAYDNRGMCIFNMIFKVIIEKKKTWVGGILDQSYRAIHSASSKAKPIEINWFAPKHLGMELYTFTWYNYMHILLQEIGKTESLIKSLDKQNSCQINLNLLFIYFYVLFLLTLRSLQHNQIKIS